MQFKANIVNKLAEILGMDPASIEPSIEIPPQPELGDFALPCFRFAKERKQAPVVIAQSLYEELKDSFGTDIRVQQTGPYLNFFLSKSRYVDCILKEYLTHPDALIPRKESRKEETIIIEFSSTNIAKPFHIGHAFSTVLGHVLSNMYEALGYHVLRFNHIGDYGTQFGKLIEGYLRWGSEEAIQEDPIQELLRVYVKFHEEAAKDPKLEDLGRLRFKYLEEGRQEEVDLWKKFRDLSLKEFDRVYTRLGISFDNYNGESFYTDKIPKVIDLLNEKSLLEESDGAQVVKLEEENMPPCIVIKSDGTTIYASRDLAAVMYRKETWNFSKNIYVAGLTQSLHFKQFFTVLKKAGYGAANDCIHVGFGLVKFPEGKMSTRMGKVILLEDVINESVAKTEEIIRANSIARGTDMSEEEIKDIAEKVGVGALIFAFVKNGREKDIQFTWEEMLNFDGDTSPYLQYTYARAKSLLKKADIQSEVSLSDQIQAGVLDSDNEFQLCRTIEGFSAALESAVQLNEPSILSKHLILMARQFNKFYNDQPILIAEPEVKNARLALCSLMSTTLKKGLNLLGIHTVERM